MSGLIDSIPQGYYLQAYDDCGVQGRQPHVDMTDCYIWTFNTSDTDADLKSRSAVFSYKKINMTYEKLDPRLSYVLALTYASDHVFNRVQSLWADGVELHGPLPLPKAKAIRKIVRLPESVTQDGKMTLEIRIHGEVNATVSIVELWANAPAKDPLKISSLNAFGPDLTGQVLRLDYEGVAGAEVSLFNPDKSEPLAKTSTDPKGWFTFSKGAFSRLQPLRDLIVKAGYEGSEVSVVLPVKDQSFEPVRYRPIPAQVNGLKTNRISLDGTWKIHPEEAKEAHTISLEDSRWKDIKVPGQWLQQGFDIPQDRTVGMAREFAVPKQWDGYRIFLRFDSIHAGTRYRLNGKELGYSENLFTPVEWEITDAVKFDENNRLDLEMKVATVSEQLSYSSAYAFHNLGGIDRSVSIYAVPKVHISNFNIITELEKDYKDADLKLDLILDNPEKEFISGLSLDISLLGPDKKPARQSSPTAALGPLPAGEKTIELITHVIDPLKWSAEKPNLYRLTLDFKQDGKLLERIEQNIGFRKIEIKRSQFYINGRKVKLAGACRHEIDPLTGRADTMKHAENDVKLLKAANLNYIRTSHYPPTKEFLEACDRLGMYVEVEAPFCGVQQDESLDSLREILTPTTAMIDYCRNHPSVVIWSMANESHLNRAFLIANEMCHKLDPTRPTTFNHPMSNEKEEKHFDISNRHYPSMPYDDVLKDDPHPLLLGEYFFPICHEQTDVSINPGLRELWGHGHADPDSEWGKFCAESFKMPTLHPGTPSGAWSYIVDSNRLIGGAIFAALDEPFYFKDGKRCGFAWVHGFWGLLDAWRRPKPEWWLAKLIFSPVWFPVRQVDYKPGQSVVNLPVENRFSFTDLSELDITWEIGRKKGKLKAGVSPGAKGQISLPIPKGTKEGEKILLKVTGSDGELINILKVQLGKEKQIPLPEPQGTPKWTDDGKIVTVEGKGFTLVLDKTTGDFASSDPRHKAPITRFPTVHVTRFDFGDLAGPDSPPYAVFPDEKTRVVEGVEVKEHSNGLEIIVRDRYEGFAGTMSWLIDKNGVGKISYNYTYTGPEMNTREAGVRLLLKPEYDQLKWDRWSEWDVFPEDSICRTRGTAKARRDPKIKADPEGIRPDWTWSQDQTELGTNDFRGIKFNIYQASLNSPGGSAVTVRANADRHVRSCLSPDGVMMHILTQCRLGQVILKPGDKVKGDCCVEVASSE